MAQVPLEPKVANVPKEPGPLDTQPVITINVILSAVSAVVVLLAYQWPALADHEDEIRNAVMALYPIVSGLWTWFAVFAPKTVRGIQEDMRDTGFR